jgi:hypothetical protein
MSFCTLVFGPAGVLCVAFVILQFYNGAYKRMGHEAHKTPLLGKTAFCHTLSVAVLPSTAYHAGVWTSLPRDTSVSPVSMHPY